MRSSPERAITFYKQVFGWSFTAWGPPGQYWLVGTGPDSEPGINGGLVPRRGDAPVARAAVNAYVCTIAVDNVDASIATAVGSSGTIALEKMAIPGVGWLGYCKDTEGNNFGMMQANASAS
ncbi:MAG: VOC family protein [Gemmatimonadaceae bacterium]